MASMPLTEIVRVLDDVPLFGELTRKQAREVARACHPVTYEPGAVLLRQRDWGQHALVVTEGQAHVSQGGRHIGKVGPGAIVGELSLIDGRPRAASVIADTDVAGLVLDRISFRALLERMPTMAHRLLVAQTARIRELDHHASIQG